MTAALAAGAVLLGFAAAWELAGEIGEASRRRISLALAALSGGRAGTLEDAAARLGLASRLQRAGLAGRLDPAVVMAAKVAGVGVGGLTGLAAAPVLPARLAPVGVALIVLAGFLAPDALLERAGRRRRERLVSVLPDALDLLAVGAASGRAPAALLEDVAGGSSGPLASELRSTVAEIECGASVHTAVTRLRARVGGAEIGALASALERSRSYGSPLAEQLHEQATSLRREARRRTEERAARAAPKIQLVVALVLVPSVLLMIAAALVAHSEALFGPV